MRWFKELRAVEAFRQRRHWTTREADRLLSDRDRGPLHHIQANAHPALPENFHELPGRIQDLIGHFLCLTENTPCEPAMPEHIRRYVLQMKFGIDACVIRQVLVRTLVGPMASTPAVALRLITRV